MRLFSYVVARDYGFAPNPFFGYCTLATCKPQIRRSANIDDFILGTGSVKAGLVGHAVFAMRVERVLSFNEYFAAPEFQVKKPRMDSGLKYAFGDNIYSHNQAAVWNQLNSHHSHPDGTINRSNLERDTKADRVLIGKEFWYWGARAQPVPARLRNFNGEDICSSGRPYKCKFSDKLLTEFRDWLRSLDAKGYIAPPAKLIQLAAKHRVNR